MQRIDRPAQTSLSTRVAARGLAAAVVALVVVGAACGNDGGSDGEAELQEFITLGSVQLTAEDRRSVELGTDEAAALAQTLDALPDHEIPDGDLRAVLTRTPPAGMTGFGFVLTGCAETGARLVITSDVISAELTGGEGVDCEAPVYFLATFHMPTENVPENAVLD